MNSALKARYAALVQEVEALKSGKPLHEKQSDHWPFKNKPNLGPGPYKGRNKRTDDWECVCSDYECDCEDSLTGETKRVKIDKGYKKKYNKVYKQWRAGRLSKEGMKKKLGKKK